MLKLVFLISFTVGLSSGQLLPKPGVCGIVPATSSLVTNGNVTNMDEYPWTVMFRYTNGTDSTKCGGSLINERYVVTAAHCVLKATGFKPIVRLGDWDRKSNPDCKTTEHNEKFCAPKRVDAPVQDIVKHPKFVEQYKVNTKNRTILEKLINDIALLRLAHPVNFTKYVSPICLPLAPELSSASFEGVELDVVGWSRSQRYELSRVKMKTTVKVINFDECKKKHKVIFDDSAICAGGFKDVNSCRGDSGGPLVGTHKTNGKSSHFFLAGIVSFGKRNCTRENYLTVYTRVGQYIDWIKENVKP